jgi:hypothetical protein
MARDTPAETVGLRGKTSRKLVKTRPKAGKLAGDLFFRNVWSYDEIPAAPGTQHIPELEP